MKMCAPSSLSPPIARTFLFVVTVALICFMSLSLLSSSSSSSTSMTSSSSSSLFVFAKTTRFNPHQMIQEEDEQEEDEATQFSRRRGKSRAGKKVFEDEEDDDDDDDDDDEVELTREYDTVERAWWAYHSVLSRIQARKEAKNKNNQKEKKRLLSEPFVPESSGCKEIRTIDELRMFASTNRPAWIVLVNHTAGTRDEATKKRFEQFRRDWEKFSRVVTFGEVNSIVAAIDVEKNTRALFPGLVNGESYFINPRKSTDKNDTTKTNTTTTNDANNTFTSMKSFLEQYNDLHIPFNYGQKPKDQHNAIRIRHFANGPKFTKETREESGSEIFELFEHVRNGAADEEADFRPSIVYKGPKSYQALVLAARTGIVSRVHDRNITTLDDFQRLVDKMKSKKVLVMIVDKQKNNLSSSLNHDEYEFAFHFLSRIPIGKDISDEYRAANTTRGFFDNKMAFVLLDTDSELGQALITKITASENLSKNNNNEPYLFFYEHPPLNNIEFEEDGRELSKEYAVRPYTKSSPLSNIELLGSNLQPEARPAPARWAVPAVECDTMTECFEKYYDRPFVVRNAPEIFSNKNNSFENVLKRVRERAADPEAFVEAVHPMTGDAVFMHITDAVDKLLNETLAVNVLDGPGIVGSFDFPKLMTDRALSDDGALELFILSPANKFTTLHHDPISQKHSSQVLFKGSKRFELMSPKYFRKLQCLADDLSVGDQAEQDKHDVPIAGGAVCKKTPEEVFEETGEKIFITSIDFKAGDFMAWPKGWSHRVWTGDEPAIAANAFGIWRRRMMLRRRLKMRLRNATIDGK